MEKIIIYDLTTEYSENPINVSTATPRFGWKIRAYDGFRQYSYRILVASSEKKLNEGEYDLWDSQTVVSCRTNNVEYCGRLLKSKDRAFWKCVVTGEKGDMQTSETARFELTLLSDDDWKGRFISMPARCSGDAQYIRYQFELSDKAVSRGRVYMAGLGYSELYCNGEKVDNRELSPSYSDYDKRVYFVTYDITPFLKVGGNCLGIVLGYGWFGDRKVKADVFIEFDDGTAFEAHTKHSLEWLVSYGAVKGNSIYDGETYDAREEKRISGWNTYGFYSYYDNGWGFCINCSEPKGVLRSDTIEPIRVIKEYDAKPVYGDGKKFLYDVSVNMAGWAKIKVKGESGTVFTIRYGEKLDKDKKDLQTLNLRTATQTDRYICAGNGEETYNPRFTYHGFQYIEIKIDGVGEILNVKGCFVGASVERISKFDSSSDVLNRLHDNTLVTEQANLHSVMTDCPQRDERFGWLNDLTPRTFEQMNNFDLAKYYEKVLQDIADTVEDGKIADTAPYNIGSRPADPTCAFLLLALRAYRRYGNVRVLKDHYDKMKGWVDYLYGESVDGVLNYCLYGDWVQPYENSKDASATTPKSYVVTVFMFWQMKLLAEIARILGKSEDEKLYSDLAVKERKIINEKFFDEKRMVYSSGSQTANTLALSLGLCDEKYEKTVAKRINDDIIARGYHITSGNQGYVHVFNVLSDFGYADTLYKTVKNTEYPGWGYALSQGATSVWERWESEVGLDMVSFNHPMFSAVDGWFFNKLCGIDVAPDAVGANEFVIKPVILSELDRISGSIRTVTGEICSAWRKENGEIVYEISVPSNTKATVYISGEVTSVVGNAVVAENTGVSAYICNGGKYVFTARYE